MLLFFTLTFDSLKADVREAREKYEVNAVVRRNHAAAKKKQIVRGGQGRERETCVRETDCGIGKVQF